MSDGSLDILELVFSVECPYLTYVDIVGKRHIGFTLVLAIIVKIHNE